jgi:hypothetical protein
MPEYQPGIRMPNKGNMIFQFINPTLISGVTFLPGSIRKADVVTFFWDNDS